MVQLKNQNTHKMAPRGEEENSAILAGTLKKKNAPFMWRVSKIQWRKKSPQNSAYWMTNYFLK